MLAEKLAAEAGVPLLCLSPSAILSKWAGESEKSVSNGWLVWTPQAGRVC